MSNWSDKKHKRAEFSSIIEEVRDLSAIDFYLYEQDCDFSRSRNGWVDGGLCQFHNDHHAGSFKLKDTGAFKCHSCSEGGANIIDFVMKKYDLSFKEAVIKIAEDAGVI